MSSIPTTFVFKNPFASSIHPILNNKISPLLHEINASRPAEKRLPTEILLRVNEELHRNALLEEIRDSWTPVEGPSPFSGRTGLFGYGESPIRSRLDPNEKKYYLQEKRPITDDIYEEANYRMRCNTWDGTSIEHLYCHISSADLLYRMRCCFPELTVDSNVDKYKTVWIASIKHNKSGIIIKFHDSKGAASFHVIYQEDSAYRKADKTTTEALSDSFALDVQLLLSIFYETVEGGRRLVYYHPAADADLLAEHEQGYIAVPYEIGREREQDEFNSVYNAWTYKPVSAADVSSFHSILHDLKYDISSRKIAHTNDTQAADLTTIISSSLLFYRLICKFMLGHSHANINTTLPITSVWQVQLTHVPTGNSIIFMDHRGLFDVRADVEAKEVSMMEYVEGVSMMEDVKALVEALCSDTCTHPYDGVVAGSIA